ncbi:MAG: glycoside hydrolase domain-containing protein [Bacteroidota bacterium]
MKHFSIVFLFLHLLINSYCQTSSSGYKPDRILPYGTGSWNSSQLGNHRVVLYVNSRTDAVRVHIPWRRRDKHPEQKGIILTDTAGKRIKNIIKNNISRASAEIVFQPASGSGQYYLYYMPYRLEGSHYPTAVYFEPVDQADPEWIEKNRLCQPEMVSELPEAKAVEIQSINEFNSFFPMEIIATKEEIDALINQHSDKSYLLFPENRKYPIRMKQDIPYRWIIKGASSGFKGTASRNEYYAFQIGIFAASVDISDIEVFFNDLKAENGSAVIPAGNLTCFNTGGINWDGKPFDKLCKVKKGNVQPLWIGIDVPRNLSSGSYRGTLTVHPAGLDPAEVNIVLKITPKILEDRGDGEPWRHSRLRWFNSKRALDYELVDPFIPLSRHGDTLSCLGRDLILGKNGLPRQILSRFAPEVTHLTSHAYSLLSKPVSFRITGKNDKNLISNHQGFQLIEIEEGIIRWIAQTQQNGINVTTEGSLEADGFARFSIKVETGEKISLRDAELIIPINEKFSKYMMGLGYKGGYLTGNIQWKWNKEHNQEGAWLGNTNGGIQFSLRGSNYARPLNTNFYLTHPLNMPDSWYNNGKGGINIRRIDNGTIRVRAFSGSRTLQPGKPLLFDLLLWITPFKPVNMDDHWGNRYFHGYRPVDTIKQTGATVINIHHGNEVSPYINYPFLTQKKMHNYIAEAHQKGLKVKIYNTIRELSNHAPELFAIRSFGREIFSEGPGGGCSWLQEHVGEDYIPAWFTPHLKDAAIINSGMSRWHNYYVEGLKWLATNVAIDGLYIDDIAFDRTTMKRVRKVLDRNRPEVLIDLHSANQFNVRDGFVNSASLYLEHFPYIDKLWFGEYFDKNASPDFWLIEMSGIPYGLMGEMLQDGGNKWRGMVYGMTARLPWAGDPRPIWKIWDSFGIKNSRMVGYWSPDCPVQTGNSKILATTYIKQNSVMIAIGSWAENEEKVKLEIDWESLSISPEQARLYAPGIQNFQSATSFDLNGTISVKPGRGWLLILEKNKELL